jgi:alkylhydroperoxidase family enzyme
LLLGQERSLEDSEALVRAILNDIDSSPLTDKEKALLQFIDKVNRDSHKITSADIDLLYAHGWSDDAIYYAITICALFNFYNRWVDASGVHALSDEAHRQGAKRSVTIGYVRK